MQEPNSFLSHDSLASFAAATVAPWTLRGEAIVLLRDWRTVLALVNYESSPVGPYLERAEATVLRVSKYFGPSVVRMNVTLELSMREGRRIWGFPKTLQPMAWKRGGTRIEVLCGGEVWRVRTVGPQFPVAVRAFTLQMRSGEAVKVPVKLRGRAQLAWRGKQMALYIKTFEMNVLEPIVMEV